MAEPVAGAAGPGGPGQFPVEAIRGVRARSAPAAACGMFADVTVDFEPSAAGVEVSLPDGLQVADGGIGTGVPLGYLAGLAEGIRAGLAAGRPDLVAAALVVVRRVQVHPADSSVAAFRTAGRIAARQALGQAGQAAGRAAENARRSPRAKRPVSRPRWRSIGGRWGRVGMGHPRKCSPDPLG